MFKTLYTETVLLAGKIVLLRGSLLKLAQWVFGYRLTKRMTRAHVIQSFEVVLDTIDTLPQEHRDRWDVREIQDMSASLLDDIRNHRDAPGEARERAFVINRKIREWRRRTDADAVKPCEEE